MKRTEMDSQLQNVANEVLLTLLVRVALRLLPTLAQKSRSGQTQIALWGARGRERHLMTILAACNISLAIAAGAKGLGFRAAMTGLAADDASCAVGLAAANTARACSGMGVSASTTIDAIIAFRN